MTLERRNKLIVLETLDHALDRPTQHDSLTDFIGSAIQQVAGSEHTSRAYLTAFSQFLQYLDLSLGERLPSPYAELWRPFAVREEVGSYKRVRWNFRIPLAILRFIGPQHLEGFANSLQQLSNQERSHATIDNRISAIRKLLRVAHQYGYLGDRQLRAIESYRRRAAREPKGQIVGRRLTPQEVVQLRAAVQSGTLIGKRDLAILDVMLFAGLRREEVCSLLYRDLYTDSGHYFLQINGKGNKARQIPVFADLEVSLMDWIKHAQVDWGIPKQALFGAFTNRYGRLQINQGHVRPLTPDTIHHLVAHYGRLADIRAFENQPLKPHDLRRTFAKNMFDNGAKIQVISSVLGHANAKITENYIGLGRSHDNATDYMGY